MSAVTLNERLQLIEQKLDRLQNIVITYIDVMSAVNKRIQDVERNTQQSAPTVKPQEDTPSIPKVTHQTTIVPPMITVSEMGKLIHRKPQTIGKTLVHFRYITSNNRRYEITETGKQTGMFSIGANKALYISRDFSGNITRLCDKYHLIKQTVKRIEKEE